MSATGYPLPPKRSRYVKRPNLVIVVGFAVAWLLMCGLLVLAMSRMTGFVGDMESMTYQQGAKIKLATQLRDLIRERELLIRNNLLVDDAFERDERRLRFDAVAQKVVETRDALRTMVMTAEERQLMVRLSEEMGQTYVLANDLMQRSIFEPGSVTDKQLAVTVDHQNQIIRVLNLLIEHEAQYMQDSFMAARDSHNNTETYVWIVGSLVTLLNLIVAYFVVQRNKALLGEIAGMAKFPYENPTPIMRADHFGVILYANPASYDVLEHWGTKISEALPEDICEMVSAVVRDGSFAYFDVECSNRIYSFSMMPVVSENYINIYGYDITERERIKRKMAHQATHDSLTGLLNRAAFEQALSELRDDALENDTNHVILYLDLDQFKVVNDTCGHIAGDDLLKQLANVIRRHVRSSDVLARLGGDEFGILFRSCTALQAGPVIEHIRAAVEEFVFYWKDNTFHVGVSGGMAVIDRNSGSTVEILSAADSACYIAKDKGRNRIHVYLEDDSDISRKKGEMRWLQRLREAMDNDQLVLYQQPIIAISDRAYKKLSCEVLLRMRMPDGEIVSPVRFIPAAERYDLMPLIDRWVIQNTLEAIVRIDRVSGKCDRYYSINLSGQTLGDSFFHRVVMDQLVSSGVEPHRICFEITETAAISNMALATDFIAEMKKMGCHFALDDFGSGLSSFNYLRALDVDYLKIDGSFIRHMHTDRISRSMVAAMCRIGHEMGLQLVAEFVENDQIKLELAKLGVDYLQGYACGHPEPLSLQELAAYQDIQAKS